jgi:hypothetical protein
MANTLFSFTLTKIGMRKAGLSGSNDYSVTQIRELQKRLKSIDPKLRTQLVRDAKAPAEAIVSKVKPAINAVTPLSGMTRGRLNWNSSIDAKGKAHKPDDVKIQFRTRSSGKSNVTSLVRVRVASPAVVMADMAGRSNNYLDAGYKGSGFTKEYSYKGGSRRHRVNGQGRKMIEKLGGSASRYVWPAAEQSIPAVKAQIEQVLARAYQTINRKGL